MQRSTASRILSVSLTCLLVCLAGAEEKKDKPGKILEVTKATPKLDVSMSQIGYRDTLLFYTFKEQSSILKLQIDNKDKTFPVVGTLYKFASGVQAEDLDKWLNNQHSDGLFVDVPMPVATQKLPGKTCRVTQPKLLDHTKQEFGEYDNYSVTVEVKDYTDAAGVTLKGFTATTKVHVPTK
jgi:hypothetical protein